MSDEIPFNFRVFFLQPLMWKSPVCSFKFTSFTIDHHYQPPEYSLKVKAWALYVAHQGQIEEFRFTIAENSKSIATNAMPQHSFLKKKTSLGPLWSSPSSIQSLKYFTRLKGFFTMSTVSDTTHLLVS